MAIQSLSTAEQTLNTVFVVCLHLLKGPLVNVLSGKAQKVTSLLTEVVQSCRGHSYIHLFTLGLQTEKNIYSQIPQSRERKILLPDLISNETLQV